MSLASKNAQWRVLMKNIGDDLKSSDVEAVMYLENIPRGRAQSIGSSGIKLLQELEETGKICEDKPDDLCKILVNIPRHDLKRKVETFKNIFKPGPSFTNPSKTSNKSTNEEKITLSKKVSKSKEQVPKSKTVALLRPGDFAASKKKPATTDMHTTYDTVVTPKKTTNDITKELTETSPTHSKPPYPMNNKPRGLCVIFSNETFDDHVNEVNLKEGEKIATASNPGQMKSNLHRTKNDPSEMKMHQGQMKNEPSQVMINPGQLKSESVQLKSDSGQMKIETSAVPTPGNTRVFCCHPETPSPGILDASYSMMGDANCDKTTVAGDTALLPSSCSEIVSEVPEPPAGNLPESTVDDTAYETNIDVTTFAIPRESDSECTAENAASCANPDIKEPRQQLDHSEYDRKGTEIDEDVLCRTFEWLQFDVKKFPNRTADEIRCELNKIAKEDHSKYDAFVCCILSHGCEKGIYGKDWNCIPISEIRSIFKGDSCKSLREKPKIFFIQACRGKDRDMGTLKWDKATESEESEPLPAASAASNIFPANASEFDTHANEMIAETSEEYSDATDENGDATEHSCAEYDACPTSLQPGSDGTPEKRRNSAKVVANDSDFLFAEATTEGNMAIRSPEKGSWFISTVCDILQSEAHQTDLLSILTDVTDEIAEKTEYIQGRYKCTPDVRQNLRRKLYFRPQCTWSEYSQQNLSK